MLGGASLENGCVCNVEQDVVSLDMLLVLKKLGQEMD